VNLTLDLLLLVSEKLRYHAGIFMEDSDESETLLDAADALDDARDLLESMQ